MLWIGGSFSDFFHEKIDADCGKKNSKNKKSPWDFFYDVLRIGAPLGASTAGGWSGSVSAQSLTVPCTGTP